VFKYIIVFLQLVAVESNNVFLGRS